MRFKIPKSLIEPYPELKKEIGPEYIAAVPIARIPAPVKMYRNLEPQIYENPTGTEFNFRHSQKIAPGSHEFE